MSEAKPGFFGRIAAAVMRRPRVALLAIAIMTLLAGALATQLKVDPDILHLLPPDDPTTVAIQQLHAREGGVNLLTIAVKGPEPERVDAFMRELATRLEALPEVDYALYDIDPEIAWRIGLVQLSPEDLNKLRARLKGALALGPAIANPFVASQWLDLGPLTEKLKSSGAVALASSGDTARVLVRPTGSYTDPKFARAFMADIYALLDELAPEDRGLQVAWVGGAYRHTVEDLEGILYDIQWTVVASLVLVVVLVGTAFRDPRAVLLIFVPLILGNVWMLGWTFLTVRTLTTFTSFTSAVLIGLGVDFSIHLYSRYREERSHGGDLQDAVVRAWDKVGPPCATAALTSAGGFCALWVAGFDGFRQLGTILAGGVLLCLTAVVVVLPLLIVWREKQPRAVPLRKVSERRRRRPPTYRLAPLGLLLIALVTGALTLLLPRVQFQFDISELRRQGMAYADLDSEEQQLAEDSYAPIVVTYPDAASLAADHVRLSEMVADGRLSEVGRVLSVYSVLPTHQDDQIAILREIAELARNPNAIYLPPQAQKNLERIASVDLRPLTADDLPAGLRHALGANGDNHRILLIPTGNMWDLRENARLHDALEAAIPDRPLAGEYLAMSVLYRLVKSDAPRIAVTALLVVFALTALDLRSGRRALGAMGALVAGLVWAGAGMAVFRLKLSMVNFVAIPILMGIGIDVVIHLLHRLSEEGPGRIRIALTTTGWAAALSTATTVVSFASLSVATSQGVRSLGVIIVLGLTLVTTAAFVAVPLGWMTTWKLRGDLPRADADSEG